METIIATIRSFSSVSKVADLIHNGKSFIARYLKIVVLLWGKLYDFLLVLRYARFSVAVLLLGAVILFVPQGRELAMRVNWNWHFIWFYIGLFFWALQSWFGARRLLDERFGRPKSKGSPFDFDWSLHHVPRIMGVSAYLFATIAFLFAWYKKGFVIFSSHALMTLLIAVTGVIFYCLVIKRHDWMLKGKDKNFDDIAFIHRYLKPITIAYSTFFIVAGIFFPATIGFWVGSLAILSFGFSSIVPVGNWAIRYTEKWTDSSFGIGKPHKKPKRATGFPVIISLLVLAFVLSFFNDNHDVRLLPDEKDRPTLEQAFTVWEQQANSVNDTKPLIIIATAGGGIRASYWTATVLGRLTDIEPGFRNTLFGISGVSGGSVGSVFYQAALKEGANDCDKLGTLASKRSDSCYEGMIQHALSHDFLAPNLSSLLYSDLIQRFLPPLGFPDRQQALEKAWELAFEKTVDKPNSEGLSAYLAEQSQKQRLPLLFLNSTHMETGKRVVASSMKLSNAYTDTVDLHNLTGKGIRLSTAAGNSARFTYVSPAGTLPCKPSGSLFTDLWRSVFCKNGHVVDGGYFENFGVITALQTLKALSGNPPPKLKQVKPILIVISSDPSLACNRIRQKKDNKCYNIEDDKIKTPLPHQSGANESLAPIKALLSTRSARGILATKTAKQWIETCKDKPDFCGFGEKPEFFHLGMEIPEDKPDPALGWMLSTESEQVITDMLTCTSTKNYETVKKILQLLGNTGPVNKNCSG